MKNGINILILFFSFIGFANAQINIEFSSSQTPTPGQTFNVDVGVSNYTDILSNQYWIKWDSTVLAFNAVNNVTTDLEAFDNNSFSTPFTTQSGKDGVIGVSWNDFDLEPPYGELPDNTNLFSIVFDVVGEPCDSTALTVEDFDVFQLIEIIDGDENEIGLTFDALPVLIPGADCTDQPPMETCGIENDNAEVTLFLAEIEGAPGETVCVPFMANDFTDITALQGGIVFDSTIVNYAGVQNLNLPPPFSASNFSEFTADSLTFLWFDNTGVTPFSSPNGGVIFEVCFEIVGEIGECSFIEILDVDNSIIDISGTSGSLEFETVCGEVCVVDVPPPGALTITAADLDVEPGEDICVPVSATNFTDILSFQYTMTWDENILEYTGLKNLSQDLPLFEGGNISYSPPNVLTVSWNSSNGECMSFPDGILLYELGFTVSPSCSEGDMTSIEFIESPSEFEVTDCDAMVIESVFQDAELTCVDIIDPPCNLGVSLTPSDVDCFGDATGSITVQATDGVGPFVCMWDTGSNGPLSTSDCVLMNVVADSYFVTITDSENCTAVASTTINEPATPLSFSSTNATDADCTTGGTVSVNVEGGTGAYAYSWDNGLSDQNAHNNLTANTYCVTVSDENSCVISTCLVVEGASDISLDCVVTNVTCDTQGAIDCTVTGSDNISYDWADIPGSPNVEDRVGLDCGEYTVTVTETTTGCTATGTYEVLCLIPDLTINIVTQDIDCDNETGSATVECTGGCPNIEYECLLFGNVVDCDEITGLAAGMYTLCKQEVGNPSSQVCEDFTIESDLGELTIDNVSSTDVSCVGAEDGTIMADISGGCGPYICYINSNVVDCGNIILPAGNYQFCVEDDNGDVCWPDSLVIGSPDPISISITEIDLTGGSFTLDATVTGGTGTLSYEWLDDTMTPIAMTEDLVNVGPGTYTLTVTDENDCTESVSYTITTEVLIDSVIVISEAEFNGFGVSCDSVCDAMVTANITGIAPFDIVITDTNGQVIAESMVLPIEGLCAGSYFLSATDATGAMSSDLAFEVTEPEPLEASVGTIICESGMGLSDGSIQMNVSGGVAPYTYEWNPEGSDGPTNPNLPAGVYTLEITDDNGCDWISGQQIEVMPCDSTDIPCYEATTVITPNGDTYNEFFEIECILAGEHTGSQLDLYDRYGRKVNGFTNYDNSWNGLDDSGEPLLEGAYYWVLELDFPNGARELLKGTVTLLRD